MTEGVSLLALALSLFTLWWTQGRPGKLVTAPPKTYAGIAKKSNFTLMFPLALVNTGARHVVVRDLRLVLEDEADLPLRWERTRTELNPSKGTQSFAAPFVLGSDDARVLFCEFQRATGRAVEVGSVRARIDIQTTRKPDWHELLAFDWHVNTKSIKLLTGPFIAHWNLPYPPP